MTVHIGKPAPEFESQAYIRDAAEPFTIGLADLRGSWVVLSFYPSDFTFVCPTEIQALAQLHAQFTAEHAVLLGASTDT